MLNKRLLASAAVAALTFMLPVQVLAAVGTFVFVVGDVRVVDRAGQSRPAARDIVLQEGETVVSGAGGTAQIRMVDNAFVAVRPDTELRFDQYRFGGREDGTESAFFSLLKGGFRSITGLIGQVNKSRYSIRTPTATVGIRGTDHETYFVPPPAPGQVPLANPGTYNTVVAAPPGSGTFMESGGVRLEIAQSQIAYAPPNEAPIFVPSAAVFTTPAAAPTQKPAPEKPAAEKPAAEEPGAEKPAAEKPAAEKPAAEAPAEPVRETAVVDNTAEAGAAAAAPSAPATEAPASSATTQARPVAATAPAVGGGEAAFSVDNMTVQAGELQLDVGTGTVTNLNTGDTFTINPADVNQDGQFALDFGVLALAESQAAQTQLASADAAVTTLQQTVSSSSTTNTTVQALQPVSTAPATSAISAASSAISSATGDVSSASSLSLASAQSTATTNAGTSASLKSTADGQVSTASAAFTANGSFADATYAVPAKSAMDSAKAALDAANAAVQAAKASVDSAGSSLVSAQSGASGALASANSALSAAQGQLAAANTENAKIGTAQSTATAALSTISAQLSIAQALRGSGTTTGTDAASCGTVKACADIAAQFASIAVAEQAAKNFTAAEAAYKSAAAASARAASFQASVNAALSAAQQAQAQIASQAALASGAVTAATSAVNAAAASAGTGAGGAQTLAGTASSQAAAAQSAHSAGTSALGTSGTNLTSVQSDAPVVAQNAVQAQYHNPHFATADRYASNFGGVQQNSGPADNRFAGKYEEARANTDYVLDGAKNLIEIRSSGFVVEPVGTTPDLAIADANVKFQGGAAQDGFSSIDTARGSIYMGRWQGGSILVDDTSNGAGVDHTVTLGPRSVHWSLFNQPAPFFVQSLSGTTSYSLAAATRPTDAAGNVGTLNSASLSANFDAQTVSAAFSLSIAAKTFGVNAPGMPMQQNRFLADNLAATCTGCSVSWLALIEGSFARTDASAAGFAYDLWPSAAAGAPYQDLVQGITVFTASTPPPVAPTVAIAENAAQQALASYNDVQASVSAAQTAATSASSADSTASGLSPVDTTPATSEISAATSAISSATSAVGSASSLSLASAQTTASANATGAATLKSTADGQVSAATSAYDANVAAGFEDAIYAPAAKSTMDSAKSSLDAANTAVQSAKTTIDTSVTSLSGAQASASGALSGANSALSSAQAQLTTANAENAKIGPAQSAASSAAATAASELSSAQSVLGSGTTTLDSAPRTANSSFASSCATALACSDLARQYADETALAQGTGDLPGALNAKNNALTAAGRAASFQSTAAAAKTAAQAAASTASGQLAIAQNAVSAAGTAVNGAATAAGTGAGGAQTLAGTASTEAANAQSAHTAGTSALSASNSNLTTATTNATSVADNAAKAQYHNPYFATLNGYGSVFLGNENVSAGSNKSANGVTEAKANTVFVLDGNRNLVEIRNTDFEVGDFSASPSPQLADANVKFSGGTAQDGYFAIDLTRGSIYGGRWQGGDIVVDDNSNGASVDYTVNLGPRSAHWLVMNQPGPGFVQNRAGSATYSVLGATRPTDAAGTVGTLNSASLTANFDTQQVGVALDLSIAAKNLVLNESGMPIQTEYAGGLQNYFGADNVPVTCTGAGCTASWESGLFGFFGRTDASAAGLVYEMKPVGTPAADLVQGNVAFTTGTPPPARPQPAQLVNIGYTFTDSVIATHTSNFNVSGTGYVLDGAGNVLSVTGEGEQADIAYAVNGGTPVPATPGEVTLTSTEKIRYGSWSGATVSGTDFNGSFANRAVDGNFHWIRGPLTSPFYLSEVLTVTNATYTFAGGAVSDHTGASGTVNSATLGINFNTLALNAGVNATVGANTWVASASNIALDGGGFFAATGSTSPHSLMTLTLNGLSTDTFGSAVGNINGQLVGAGLEGAIMSYAFAYTGRPERASGTAAFTGPTQSASAPFTIGVVAQGMLATTGTSIAPVASPLPGLEPDFASNVDIMLTASSRIARDSANQVNRFDGYVPLPQPSGCTSACSGVTFSPATFALRDANYPLDAPPSPGAPTPAGALTNTGSHAPTGITWGRYTGFVNYSDRLGGAGAFTANAFDVRQANWHAMWSPSMTSAPVLPTSGTFTYTPIGNTNPTDNLGNIGSLTSATLQANFTAMTVNSSVNINMPSGPGAGAWSASAMNVPIQKGVYFEAGKGVSGLNNLTVSAPVAGATAGVVRGTFVGNHVSGTTGGVMKGVSLNVGGAAGTTVSTVVGFTK